MKGGATARTVSAWIVGLGGVAVLLTGRYDWSSPYSTRGFASSFYLVAVFLPTLHFTTSLLAPGRRRLTWGVTIGAALLCSLPYRWLGLEGWSAHHARPIGYAPRRILDAVPETNAAPAARFWLETTYRPKTESIGLGAGVGPGSFLGFGILGAVAVALGLQSLRCGVQAVPRGWFWSAVATAMLAEASAHASLHSPYTYTTHFYRPASAGYWHVAYLLSPPEGAVNGDAVSFLELEDHFLGSPRPTSTALIRRPFVNYLGSQLSYFLNAYYVYSVLNLLLWIAACASTYGLVTAWTDPEVGTYAALMVVSGPGFIMYVAQPMPYVAGYALVAIVLYLCDHFLLAPDNVSLARQVLFGGVLGLATLCYDLFGLLPCLLGLAWLRKVELRRVVVAGAVSVAVYQGFLWLQQSVLRLTLDPLNSQYLSSSARNCVELFLHGPAGEIYRRTLLLGRLYLSHMANAFFALPAALAFAGVCALRTGRRVALVCLLLTPSALGVAFLTYGNAVWGHESLAAMPRFVFPAYPAVYLLAAVALAEMRRFLAATGWPRLGLIAVGLALAATTVLASLDVIADVPQLYYFFYWSTGGYFPPPV